MCLNGRPEIGNLSVHARMVSMTGVVVLHRGKKGLNNLPQPVPRAMFSCSSIISCIHQSGVPSALTLPLDVHFVVIPISCHMRCLHLFPGPNHANIITRR